MCVRANDGYNTRENVWFVESVKIITVHSRLYKFACVRTFLLAVCWSSRLRAPVCGSGFAGVCVCTCLCVSVPHSGRSRGFIDTGAIAQTGALHSRTHSCTVCHISIGTYHTSDDYIICVYTHTRSANYTQL